MPWTDERIAASLAELDPIGDRADEAPTPTDWARLRRITASAPAGRRSRPRMLWAVPIAASVILVAVGVASVTGAPEPAFAATPPPLHVDSISQSASAFLDESVRTLLAAPPTEARREGQLVRWQYGQGNADVPVIVPARYVWDRDASGRGSLVVTAERSYSVRANGEIVDPAGPAPSPGSEVDPSPQAAYLGAFPTLPSSDPDGLAAALRDALSLPAAPSAVDYWGAFQVLLNEWSLTPAHHAAMLQLLQRAGGTELLGTVTDRLGREGIALRLPVSPNRPVGITIVVNPATRQIIASDVTYTGNDDLIDEPVGSVIEYSAWNTP